METSHSRLSQGQLELTAQQRESSKVERANRKLREELRLLQEHIAEETVPKAQMEAYKKEVDDRVCGMVSVGVNLVAIGYVCPCPTG